MKLSVFLAMTLLTCLTAKGQSPKGDYYWVVESNSNVPDHSVVKIYDQQNELVHEVTLDTRLDITKRKHRKTLVQVVKRYSDREAPSGKKLKSRHLDAISSL